jgi:hypothetical protein
VRPKPQRGDPSQSSEAVYLELVADWLAEAMQDAADRIEAAVERLERAARPRRRAGDRCDEPFVIGPDFYRCHRAADHELPHWGAKR